MVKFILHKASDSEFEDEVCFEEIHDLIDFLAEDVECGTIVVEKKRYDHYDYDESKGFIPVYKDLETPVITIYDDYLE